MQVSRWPEARAKGMPSQAADQGVSAKLNLTGAVGSPVNPIAVK